MYPMLFEPYSHYVRQMPFGGFNHVKTYSREVFSCKVVATLSWDDVIFLTRDKESWCGMRVIL